MVKGYIAGARKEHNQLAREVRNEDQHTNTSALKSGPVLVLLPFLEGLRTVPVPESFRIQELRTRTAKNHKKLVVTGRNWSWNEYNKMRARSAKLGHVL